MGLSAEERSRLRAHIERQADTLPLADLARKMRADGEALCAALEAVAGERWHVRPGPAEWSAAELAGHALEVIERDAAIVSALRPGLAPPPFEPDELGATISQVPPDAAAFRAAFISRREAFLALMLEPRAEESLTATIDHPWFGPLNWRQWLLFMRIHDTDHTRYVREMHVPA